MEIAVAVAEVAVTVASAVVMRIGVALTALIGEVALAVLGIRQLVVAVDVALVLGRQVVVRVEVGGVLDAVLVEGQLELVTRKSVAAHGHQAAAHAEQPVADLHEGGLAGVVVDENLLDRAQLVAVAVVSGGVEEILDVLLGGHVDHPSVVLFSGRP